MTSSRRRPYRFLWRGPSDSCDPKPSGGDLWFGLADADFELGPPWGDQKSVSPVHLGWRPFAGAGGGRPALRQVGGVSMSRNRLAGRRRCRPGPAQKCARAPSDNRASAPFNVRKDCRQHRDLKFTSLRHVSRIARISAVPTAGMSPSATSSRVMPRWLSAKGRLSRLSGLRRSQRPGVSKPAHRAEKRPPDRPGPQPAGNPLRQGKGIQRMGNNRPSGNGTNLSRPEAPRLSGGQQDPRLMCGRARSGWQALSAAPDRQRRRVALRDQPKRGDPRDIAFRRHLARAGPCSGCDGARRLSLGADIKAGRPARSAKAPAHGHIAVIVQWKSSA